VGNSTRAPHRNREIALPLLVAEERVRAKQDGKALLIVGNVDQEKYLYLGIRTFESLKGDNTIFQSDKPYRIVILGTHPPAPVIETNSLVFGGQLITGMPRNPGENATPTRIYRYQTAQRLVEADIIDKVSQIIARVRGFRDRPDCDVVVYLWDMIDEIHKIGKFPFVWLPDANFDQSIVHALYNKGKEIDKDEVKRIATIIQALGLSKDFIAAAQKYNGTSLLERNLKMIATRLGVKTKMKVSKSA